MIFSILQQHFLSVRILNYVGKKRSSSLANFLNNKVIHIEKNKKYRAP